MFIKSSKRYVSTNLIRVHKKTNRYNKSFGMTQCSWSCCLCKSHANFENVIKLFIAWLLFSYFFRTVLPSRYLKRTKVWSLTERYSMRFCTFVTVFALRYSEIKAATHAFHCFLFLSFTAIFSTHHNLPSFAPV